ncbi:Di-copper centre-containing protein, partial [Neoconidiobolus thromboides FSU 785]
MLKLLLAGLLFSSALISGAEAQCQRKYVRKEFRKLTDDERTRFFNAVKKLNEGEKPTTYDKFALAHIANSKFAHGHTGFLVWHRQFLLEFETELQKVDPEVSIPYWNWPYDSQAPEKSGLFTERYFGGNGNPDNDDCVEDGAFANWEVLYDGSGKEDKHCLKRRFKNDDGSMGVFYAPEAIKAIVDKADKYSDLTRTFEAAPHGGPHVAIGGDMRLHSSPNDPIFWLHHGYVDKVYYDWQVQHPEIQDTYDGFGVNRRPASKSDILRPHKNPVGDVTDINKLCYSYSDD